MSIQAIQTDLTVEDIPESEIFPVEELGEFRIRLIGDCSSGMGDIISFAELVKRHKGVIE